MGRVPEGQEQRAVPAAGGEHPGDAVGQGFAYQRDTKNLLLGGLIFQSALYCAFAGGTCRGCGLHGKAPDRSTVPAIEVLHWSFNDGPCRCARTSVGRDGMSSNSM